MKGWMWLSYFCLLATVETCFWCPEFSTTAPKNLECDQEPDDLMTPNLLTHARFYLLGWDCYWWIWYLLKRAERDLSSAVSSVAIYYVNKCKTLTERTMNGPWKRLQKPKQRKGKFLLWGKPPPAPVRETGPWWGGLFSPSFSHSLFLNSGPTSNPRPPPPPSAVTSPTASGIPAPGCLYICKNVQDQTSFSGVIRGVILVADSVNKGKYSALAGAPDCSLTRCGLCWLFAVSTDNPRVSVIEEVQIPH